MLGKLHFWFHITNVYSTTYRYYWPFQVLLGNINYFMFFGGL